MLRLPALRTECPSSITDGHPTKIHIKGVVREKTNLIMLRPPCAAHRIGGYHATTEEGHRLLTAEWSEEERIRQDARNLMLLEWAKELLLEES